MVEPESKSKLNGHDTARVPEVSIGLPVFNGAVFLNDCLDAILNQTYTNFELVISDNASTDETQHICERYQKLDQRIRYVRQERNLGAARNYNIVFERSRGKYFRWAAHDDVILPSYLELCVKEFEEDVDHRLALVYPRTLHFDERTGASAQYSVPFFTGCASPVRRLAQCLTSPDETILTKCYPVFGLMRADILRTTRLIQPFNSSDKVLLVEMMLRGDFCEIQPCLFHRRLHDQTSLNACRSQEEVATWFDPANRNRPPMPYTRLLLGYIRAVQEAQLDIVPRCRGQLTVAKWCLAERVWRPVLKETIKSICARFGITIRTSTPLRREYLD